MLYVEAFFIKKRIAVLVSLTWAGNGATVEGLYSTTATTYPLLANGDNWGIS